jgi:hypothetical protein
LWGKDQDWDLAVSDGRLGDISATPRTAGDRHQPGVCSDDLVWFDAALTG